MIRNHINGCRNQQESCAEPWNHRNLQESNQEFQFLVKLCKISHTNHMISFNASCVTCPGLCDIKVLYRSSSPTFQLYYILVYPFT